MDKSAINKEKVEDRDCDVLYNEYLRAKVKKAEDDYKNGRYLTVEELKEEVKSW